MRGAFIGALCGFAVFCMAAVIFWLSFMAEMLWGLGDPVLLAGVALVGIGAAIGWWRA